MSYNILVFYGSVRESRQGIKAARFVINKLSERGHKATLIDPQLYDFGLLNWRYNEYDQGKAPKKMEELASRIKKADGFVVVSAEYNHSIPPALANLMDHFKEEYFFRPSAIVTYSNGRLGGVRAAMQLRVFLAALGTASIPTLFPIANVQDTFEEDGHPVNERYHEYIKKFIEEFEWYCESLRYGRSNKSLPY